MLYKNHATRNCGKILIFNCTNMNVKNTYPVLRDIRDIPPQTTVTDSELFVECLDKLTLLYKNNILILCDFNVTSSPTITSKASALNMFCNFFNQSV